MKSFTQFLEDINYSLDQARRKLNTRDYNSADDHLDHLKPSDDPRKNLQIQMLRKSIKDRKKVKKVLQQKAKEAETNEKV